MKKFLLLLCIMLSAFCTLQAKDFQMRVAIEKFLANKNLESLSQSYHKGVDNVNGETRSWSVVNYGFRLKRSDYNLLHNISEAHLKDRKEDQTELALREVALHKTYTLRYSNQMPPVIVGSQTENRTVVVLSGEERKGVNTVLALDYCDDDDDIEGNIYIIERHPSFKEEAAAKEAAKHVQGSFMEDGLALIQDAINSVSEDVRRLYFYANKYEEEAEEGNTCSAIVKATVLVVSDIIQKGTNEDKLMAKLLIDRMIAATPDPLKTPISNDRKAAYEDNAKTLLNLLSRLDAKTEYSSLKSTSKTFRINGMIDEELWDIGYYISMSDNTMGDPTQDVELVKAEGQTFHYQTELDGIRLGRVRALFKDGTVCSAWIELLFVPGETAELTVHNGHYSLSGTGFYKDWNDAHNTFAWANGPSSLRGDKRDKAFLDILREHTDRPAFFVYAFKENIIRLKETRQKAYNLLPKETKESPYGVFLRKYL